jgi:hypothetical protein
MNIPRYWKIARVTPIYKSENKTDCGNYRPISIISNVAQVFEKVIYSQLITFLNETKLSPKINPLFVQIIQQRLLSYYIQ